YVNIIHCYPSNFRNLTLFPSLSKASLLKHQLMKPPSPSNSNSPSSNTHTWKPQSPIRPFPRCTFLHTVHISVGPATYLPFPPSTPLKLTSRGQRSYTARTWCFFSPGRLKVSW